MPLLATLLSTKLPHFYRCVSASLTLAKQGSKMTTRGSTWNEKNMNKRSSRNHVKFSPGDWIPSCCQISPGSRPGSLLFLYLWNVLESARVGRCLYCLLFDFVQAVSGANAGNRWRVDSIGYLPTYLVETKSKLI